jgi:hypothetical protein
MQTGSYPEAENSDDRASEFVVRTENVSVSGKGLLNNHVLHQVARKTLIF